MVLRNTEKKKHEKRNKDLRATLILRPFTLQTSQPVAPDLQSPGQKRRLGPWPSTLTPEIEGTQEFLQLKCLEKALLSHLRSG